MVRSRPHIFCPKKPALKNEDGTLRETAGGSVGVDPVGGLTLGPTRFLTPPRPEPGNLSLHQGTYTYAGCCNGEVGRGRGGSQPVWND